jgi:5-methylcytosine-specific restriction endonuclease McrA
MKKRTTINLADILKPDKKKIPYSEKLKDPRWQKKRLEILSGDDFTYQYCGNTEETLHVHHYVYTGEPW